MGVGVVGMASPGDQADAGDGLTPTSAARISRTPGWEQ
ncbi:hypothetical protein GJR88_04656 [Dietzia sp. DQ12-45-1b]|nr:hypothetical protein GJR88_04656 [Dietzia sp. DQ12-45-1b]